MIDDLAPKLIASKKSADLLGRLEGKDTQNALAAEVELASLWAVSTVAEIDLYPRFSGVRQVPEAQSRDLFPSGPSVIEVTALHDDVFSGKEAMKRTARKIVHAANAIRRGSGQRLTFEFLETMTSERGRFGRVRCVDPEFGMSSYFEEALRDWLFSEAPPDGPDVLRLAHDLTDVVITRHKGPVVEVGRVWSSMPAVTYDIEDNPIYKALEQKAEQLKRVPSSLLRCVFVFDVGSQLLRYFRSYGVHEIRGPDIVRHALSKLNLDVVCMFSPYRQPPQILEAAWERPVYWKIEAFKRRRGMPRSEYEKLDRVALALPRPRFEGYQARSLHEQGYYDYQKHSHHLTASMTWNYGMTEGTIRISARQLQLLLAGRITIEDFQKNNFGDSGNEFARFLKQGCTISNIVFESTGLEDDDDIVALEFRFDPSAMALRSPRGS